MAEYMQLSFKTAQPIMEAAWKARRSLVFMGPPGVGKTAMVQQFADSVSVELWTIICSGCDPTDMGGLPVVKADGCFERIPMRAILEAAGKGVILFFDEVSCAPQAVQATLLRGFHEGWFGDVKIHKDTWMVAACNPPEQSAGGGELATAFIGRNGVYDFLPTMDEVRTYFENLGEEGSKLRAYGRDFAATTYKAPDLVCMTPPENAITDAAQWAAPRNWDNGFQVLAQCDDPNPALVHRLMAGFVGAIASSSWQGILKLRQYLPDESEILMDPENAMVPENPEYQAAAMGVLANVAAKDYWAAFVYAGRLGAEAGIVVAQILRGKPMKGSDKWRGKGMRAMTKLSSLHARIGE